MSSRQGSVVSSSSIAKFQKYNRARSASGIEDDYYAESEPRSFICSKPGFVCLAAVLFTVAFITMAYFLETGLPWQLPRNNNSSHRGNESISGAGFGIPNRLSGNTDNANNLEDRKVDTQHPNLPNLEESHSLFIYTPFDNKKKKQQFIIRSLMDAQAFGEGCTTDFKFSDLINFVQVESSSESKEANNYKCENMSDFRFEHIRDGNKKRSKYLFVVVDPRSLVYHDFDKHVSGLVDCKNDAKLRCLYDEEILGNAERIIREWNNRTRHMISVCEKLTSSQCHFILMEQLIMKLPESLEAIAKFLIMDFGRDTLRIINEMVLKIDEGSVEPTNDHEKRMFEFLESLLPDISGLWPWVGKLPHNFYEHLSTWAPLMGRLGYGYGAQVPVFDKLFTISDVVRK